MQAINNKGFNVDVQKQIEIFMGIIRRNEQVNDVVERASLLGLQGYYIGAGCLVQTVWNVISNYDINHGIKDIDIVYYDNQRMSKEDEESIQEKAFKLYSDIPLKIDIKNQARVHLWYEEKFGFPIQPYRSVEEAINTWPTTASAVGVRRADDGIWKAYAPYGFNDMFGMIVRANKTMITKDIFYNKAERWVSQWPLLEIIPWD